jgi:hypothetical protein
LVLAIQKRILKIKQRIAYLLINLFIMKNILNLTTYNLISKQKDLFYYLFLYSKNNSIDSKFKEKDLAVPIAHPLCYIK